MADLTLAQKQAIAIAEALGASPAESGGQYDSESPIASSLNTTSPIQSISNKIAETLSGGKFGSMQDVMYGGQKPSDSFFGKAGQILDQSGLTGLTGIPKVAEVPALGAYIGKNIPNIPKVGAMFPKATSVVNSLPANFLAFMSNKNPERFNTLYNINKEGNPVLQKAVKEAIPLGKELYDDMIYNYARKLQLPHEVALKAKDYSRGHPEGLGAWDLLDVNYLPNSGIPAAIQRLSVNNASKPFSQLTEAQKLKQATQAGVDTAVWSPFAPKTGQAFSREDLFNLSKWLIPAMPHALPLAALKSPRVAGEVAAIAGKAANIGGKGKEAIKSGYSAISPAVDDYYQQLFGLLSTQNQQGQ